MDDSNLANGSVDPDEVLAQRRRAAAAIARAKALSRGYSGGPSAEIAVREMRDEL